MLVNGWFRCDYHDAVIPIRWVLDLLVVKARVASHHPIMIHGPFDLNPISQNLQNVQISQMSLITSGDGLLLTWLLLVVVSSPHTVPVHGRAVGLSVKSVFKRNASHTLGGSRGSRLHAVRALKN